ncbi:MAG: glycosyltransferase family 2 protein [Bacteroidota bacterium]
MDGKHDVPGKLDLTIYLTSYNEEKMIEGAISRIVEALQGTGIGYEVIVMDDCSRDDSVNVVRHCIDKYQLGDRVRLVVNETNQGIGVNYYRAAEMGRGEYFIVLFGDNPVPLEAMKTVFALIGQADIIIPHYNTRLFNMTDNCDHRVFIRRMISVLYTPLIRILSGHRVAYFNGFCLHRRALVLKHRVNAFGLGYQAEMLTKILDETGITYREVKVHNYDRAYGLGTAFRPRNVLSVAGSLWRIFWRRLTCKRQA